MKKIRSERRFSLSEISKNTGIQSRYLEYLENGEYERLPADVYVKGFLKTYAAYAGLSEKTLIKLYEREKGIQKSIKKIDDEESFIKPLNFSRFVITPKIIVGSLITLFVLLGFFYLYKEVNDFVSTPRLIITRPADNEIIEGRMVNVKGLTDKNSEVFINDQPVLANDEGEFSEDVGLQEGLNTIVVKSKNNFDKETTRSLSVRADIEDQPADEEEQKSEEGIMDEKTINMEITVRPNPTWLSVEADGSVVFSGTLLPQAVQKFEAKEKINVTTGKGNNTYIKVNGKDIGVLSEEPGIVRDVTFDAGTEY